MIEFIKNFIQFGALLFAAIVLIIIIFKAVREAWPKPKPPMARYRRRSTEAPLSRERDTIQ